MRIKRLIIIALLAMTCSIITRAQSPNPTPVPTPSPMTVKRIEVYSSSNPWCPKPPETPSPSPNQTPQQATATATATPQPAPTPPCVAGIGDTVIVTVDNLSTEVAAGRLKLGDLLLFINGRQFKGLNTRWWEKDQVAFDLKRTSDSTDAWTALLSQPGLDPLRKTEVSVGFADRAPLPATDSLHKPTILLRVFYQEWAIFSLIALILTLGFFFYLATRTGIIRDPGPPKLSVKERPYSLARTQAAFWFFLVIGSFIFLYLITGDYNTITEQALILMGIGTGTALGSAMIDASKSDSANDTLAKLNPQQAQLAEEVKQLSAQQNELNTRIQAAGANATDEDKKALSDLSVQLSQEQASLAEINKQIDDASSGLSKPASEGFSRDLLTDVNGINFHRFQMLVWTIVLGFLFLAGVYSSLTMPQFNGTLLALMGISSGTFLGFKIPEKQN
jgi:hypothetical protein